MDKLYKRFNTKKPESNVIKAKDLVENEVHPIHKASIVDTRYGLSIFLKIDKDDEERTLWLPKRFLDILDDEDCAELSKGTSGIKCLGLKNGSFDFEIVPLTSGANGSKGDKGAKKRKIN